MSSEESQWEDLMGNGSVKKRIISRGDTSKFPEYKSKVIASWVGKLDNGEVFEDRKKVGLVIGESDVVPGLELCIRHMALHERSSLKCASRFAYGPTGRQSTAVDGKWGKLGEVPPDEDVTYEVEVLEILDVRKSPGLMTFQERLEAGLEKKDIGNMFFKEKNYAHAARCYNECIQFVEGYDRELEYKKQKTQQAQGQQKSALEATSSSNETVESCDANIWNALHKLRVDAGNNLAVVFMKRGEMKKAQQACANVLQVAPNDLKALIRAGKVSVILNDWPEARLALDTAANVVEDLLSQDSITDNSLKTYETYKKQVSMEKRRLKQSISRHKTEEKAAYSNAFRSRQKAKRDRSTQDEPSPENRSVPDQSKPSSIAEEEKTPQRKTSGSNSQAQAVEIANMKASSYLLYYIGAFLLTICAVYFFNKF